MVERLEQFFKANSIDNEKKTAVFLTAIGTNTSMKLNCSSQALQEALH